jgi:hypothetical protein
VTKIVDQPEPGYYITRLVKGGPLVPVLIWLEDGERDEAGDLLGDQRLMCLVNGEPRDPMQEWAHLKPCSADVWKYMTEDVEWVNQWAQHDPKLRPREPVDYARIGHNAPPLDNLEQAAELLRNTGNFTSAYLDLDTARRAVLYVKRIQVLEKRIEAAWKEAEKPHKEAATEAGKALRLASEKLNAFRTEALRFLHAYRMMLGPEARIDTDYGAKAFGRVTKKLVIDEEALSGEYKMLVPDEDVIRGALDNGNEIEGARYENVHSTVVS